MYLAGKTASILRAKHAFQVGSRRGGGGFRGGVRGAKGAAKKLYWSSGAKKAVKNARGMSRGKKGAALAVAAAGAGSYGVHKWRKNRKSQEEMFLDPDVRLQIKEALLSGQAPYIGTTVGKVDDARRGNYRYEDTQLTPEERARIQEGLLSNTVQEASGSALAKTPNSFNFARASLRPELLKVAGVVGAGALVQGAYYKTAQHFKGKYNKELDQDVATHGKRGGVDKFKSRHPIASRALIPKNKKVADRLTARSPRGHAAHRMLRVGVTDGITGIPRYQGKVDNAHKGYYRRG